MHKYKKGFHLALALVIGLSTSQNYAQNIVSVDAGVLPSTPNIVGGGRDFYENDNDPNDQTDTLHGNVAASVIASVFSGAQIVPVKIVGPGFDGSTGITDAGLLYANTVEGARVIVKSTGPTASFSSWQQIVNANKVAVMRAGNNSKPNPDTDAVYAPSLGGRAIVVGASDGGGNIAAYSNRAGSTANSFILAPGFNQFTSVQGTSFAAPHVAAVAAMILSQNPNLSAEQVVEIILTTADDRGAPGVDNVNGHGLLNVQRATAPIDTGGGSSSGSGGALAAAAIIGGGALIYAILKNRKDDSLENTFITDIYDRGFLFDLTNSITPRKSGVTLTQLLSEFDQSSTAFMVNNNQVQTTYANFSTDHNDRKQLSERVDPIGNSFNDETHSAKLSFYSQAHDGSTSSRFSINDDIRSEFGAMALFKNETNSTPDFEYNKAYSNPYLSFTDQGISTLSNHKVGQNLAMSFGLSKNEDTQEYGLKSDSAVVETTYQTERFGVGMQLGSMREMGSLFGGASGGVLSVEESNTLSLGVSGRVKVNDKFSMIANYTQGYTKVDDWQESYLQNFSSIKSDAYAIGLIGEDVFSSKDKIGFGYSRPLKVKSGSVDLNVPQGREDFGEPLYYSNERINLNPTGNEQAFEFYYTFKPTKRAELTTYFLHQIEPNHDSDAKSDNTVMATLKFNF